MPLKAILLGSLGTLADTSELQRRAWNAAFAEAGLDWEWSEDEHAALASRPNPAERVARYARGRRGRAVDVFALQRRKSEIFHTSLAQVAVPPRPGLRGLIRATRGAGMRLGLVTTSALETVEAMLAVTGLDAAAFDFVGDASMVTAPKPAPDIYRVALAALKLAPAEALAIEAMPGHAAAAEAAGIHCVSFPGAAHVGMPLGAVSRRVSGVKPAFFEISKAPIARRA